MARKDKGMFIGICAPFGYLKSKNNACELLVDEEAAAVVKSILRFVQVERVLPVL